jgi:hypothetical protein
MDMSHGLQRAAVALLITAMAACGGRQAQVSSPAAGSAPAPAQSISVNDGESLIRAMHARYLGRWYKDITFNQTTTLMGPTGQLTDQLWYVAIAAPGKQRIDYVNPDLGNGILQRSDSTYIFSGGRAARATAAWNDLLLLTQDVYMQPPEVTISILRSLGYQLSRLRVGSFDGRTAYIVGSTSQADSSSKQFWVERERMMLVRIRERRAEGAYSDIRVGDFVKVGDGFIARQTFQYQNGVPRLHQQVANAKVDTPLDPDLFEPKLFASVKHWSKP